MRKILVALCVFAVMVAVSNPAVAQEIDFVDYMNVTPGQWKIQHREDICSGESEDEAIATLTTTGTNSASN